ncbi:hypothetical protein TWF481_006094 [Arthrobotrys musiformis]|uniref:Protein kinase domain-containing protein n=1 Tax=Arthrobotrys musiformis TaxID=47236 RepID=A0AAV9WFR0_9PEZI
MAVVYCDKNAANKFRNTISPVFLYGNRMSLDGFIQSRQEIFDKLQLPENLSQLTDTLGCDCDRCARYPLSNTPGDKYYIADLVATIKEVAISTYALCVYLRYSRLIVPLLEKQVTDQNLSIKVRSEADLRKLAVFQPDTEETALISDFLELAGKITAPKLRSNDPHLEFNDIRSLPFLLPPNYGSGEISLPNRYNELRPFDLVSGTSSFYVTRSRTNKENFKSEKFRYEWLRRKLGGSNIMKMLFSFRLQDNVYVIYDKAESNLRDYLNNPPPGNHRWLLEQFSCVVDAMETIQRTARNYASTESTAPSTEFYGVHFNLEPSKLLIGRNKGRPVLLVAGFGRQVPRDDVSDYFDYTPPEAFGRDQAKNSKNHKYHVWSLGYILLGIIKRLEPIAITNGKGSTKRSMSLNGHSTKLSQAPTDDSNRSVLPVQPSDTPPELIELREKWKTDTLMCGRLDLIRDMVEVNFRHRPSLRTVSRIYKHLFDDTRSDIDAFTLPGDNEREVGLGDVRWLRLFEGPRVTDFGSGTPMNYDAISALFSRSSRRCRIQIFEGYRDERPTPDLRIASIAHREEADLVSQVNAYRGPSCRPNERLYLWFVRFAARNIDPTNGEQAAAGARDAFSTEKCALSICNNFYVFDQMTGEIRYCNPGSPQISN